MSAKQLSPDVSFDPDSGTTFLNVYGWPNFGKVMPEQIYVGSLFRNSNVNMTIVTLSFTQCMDMKIKVNLNNV